MLRLQVKGLEIANEGKRECGSGEMVAEEFGVYCMPG